MPESKVFTCEDCGKTYKHHASLYKHQRKHKHGKFATVGATSTHGGEDSSPSALASDGTHENALHIDESSPPPPEGSNEGSKPDVEHPKTTYAWQSFEVDMEDEASTPIPSVLKGLKRQTNKKKVANMTGAEKDSQKRIIGIAFRSVDGILEKYGQAVIENEDFEISRSQSDYDWISGLTLDMCEEQGWAGIPISATGLWAIGTGYWVGKPMTEIQRKRTKPLGKGGKGFLTRLPIIGRFIQRRKNKKVQDIIQDIVVEEVESDGTY
jgi:hypothetical protein